MTDGRSIGNFTSDLRPVQPVSSVPLFLISGGVFFVCAACVVALFGLRAGGFAHFAAAAKPLYFLLLALAGIAALFSTSFPGGRIGLKNACFLGGLAGVFAVFLISIIMVEGERSLEALSLPSAMICFSTIGILGAGMLAMFLAWLRSMAPEDSAFSGLLAGFSAGCLATAAYALHCPVDHPVYILAWYGGTIFLLSMLGSFTSAHIIKW